MTDPIRLPGDRLNLTYDRDRLETALLIYLDLLTADPLTAVPKTARKLRELGFDLDALTYSVAARIANTHGIDPRTHEAAR